MPRHVLSRQGTDQPSLYRFAVQYASSVDAYAVDTAEEPKTMVRSLTTVAK